jgi:hypothetical protein
MFRSDALKAVTAAPLPVKPAMATDTAAVDKAWQRVARERAVHELLAVNLDSDFADEWDLRMLRWALEPLVQARASELVFTHDAVNGKIEVCERSHMRKKPLYVLHECDAVRVDSQCSSSDYLSLAGSASSDSLCQHPCALDV